LPEQTPLVERGPESLLLDCGLNQFRRMQEDSELQPDHSKAKIGNGQTKARPPSAIRKAHHQYVSCSLGGGTGKFGHVRIATDDPIHHDDIGGFNLGPRIGEVHDLSLDVVGQAGLNKQFERGGFVGGCQLNIYCSSHPGLEQLDLDGSDATAHLEKRLAVDAAPSDEIKDSLRSSIEALSAVPLCFSGRFFSLKICL